MGKDGGHALSVTPTVAGEYQLAITLGGAHVRGSPFAVRVAAARPHAAAFALSGTPPRWPTLEAGASLSLQLIAKDRYGNALDAPAAAPPVVQLVALESESRRPSRSSSVGTPKGKARPNGPVSAAKAKLNGGGGGGGVSAAAPFSARLEAEARRALKASAAASLPKEWSKLISEARKLEKGAAAAATQPQGSPAAAAAAAATASLSYVVPALGDDADPWDSAGGGGGMIDPWAAALDAPEAAEAAVLAQNGAEPSVRCGVTHLGDGVYEVTATPWRAGEYQLVLHVEGDDSADENGGGGGRTVGGGRSATL